MEPEDQNSQACHGSQPRPKRSQRCLLRPQGDSFGEGRGCHHQPASVLRPIQDNPAGETKKRRLGGAGCGGGARPARSMRRETRSLPVEGERGRGRGRVPGVLSTDTLRSPARLPLVLSAGGAGLKSEKGLWDLAALMWTTAFRVWAHTHYVCSSAEWGGCRDGSTL